MAERGVPFILVTDDGDTTPAEPALRGALLMTKGTATAELHRAMVRTFGGAP
jgi:hypothetical protein